MSSDSRLSLEFQGPLLHSTSTSPAHTSQGLYSPSLHGHHLPTPTQSRPRSLTSDIPPPGMHPHSSTSTHGYLPCSFRRGCEHTFCAARPGTPNPAGGARHSRGLRQVEQQRETCGAQGEWTPSHLPCPTVGTWAVGGVQECI